MSNKLGGKQGTAYLGTNAVQPPDYTFTDRDPTQYDVNNVTVGDFWLNQTDQSLWVLVSLAGIPGSHGSLATWSKLESGGMSTLNELTGNTGGPVAPDGSSNINIVGDGIGITITGNPATHTLTASLIGGGTPAESFPTDAGTAIPVAGVLNIKANTASVHAGSTVSFSASGNTVTFNVTDASDNTIIGASSGNTGITGGDNTVLGEACAVALTSGSDNTIVGSTAGAGITSGSDNIVVGSGSGSALTTTSSNTLIGHSGVAASTNLVVIARGAGGAPFLHNFPGSNASTSNGGNLFAGANAGNFTLAGAPGNAANIGLGSGSLSSLTTGFQNNAMGAFTLQKVTTGSNNTAIGHNAGYDSFANTGLITGSYNVIIGTDSGDSYTGAESSNILISHGGVVSENNTIHLGTTGTGNGQQSKLFAAGVRGVTPDTNDGIPVFVSSTGQLGTVGSFGSTIIQTVTGNTGGAVGPSAGNINIVGDGTTIQITGNPGTNTLTVVGLGGGGGDLSILTGDTGSATAAAGTIDVITNNAALGAGSSVLFSGTSNVLTLIVTDANSNTIIGNAAGKASITGIDNTALGEGSAAALTSGGTNVIIGAGTGADITTGSDNTIVGTAAASSLLTGAQNVIIGSGAGDAYTSSESSNILINSDGVIAESHVLRIGVGTGTGTGQLNKSFIAGIRGITPATTDGVPVFIGSAGQLGTVGTGGTALISTLTGNTGGAVSPSAGNINIVGDGTTIEITGNPGTNTLTVVGLGGGGGDLSILTGDSGSATAAAGTIDVITDNAAQAAGSSVLFTGSGNTLTLSVTDGNDNTIIGNGCGNASITGTDNTVLGQACASALTTGSSNIFLGIETGSLVTTGTGNFLCGDASLATVLKGTTTSTGLYAFGASTGSLFLHNWGGATSGNTFVGFGSGASLNAGQQASNKNNTGCGKNTLQSITTGTTNVALGNAAGASLLTGTGNTLVGSSAGTNYTSSESNNVLINSTGIIAESNILRIGQSTGSGASQLNKAFIAGIRGITTDISNAIPVVIDSLGQLGTAGGSSVITNLTGNTGGAVSATAGNINVVGDGVTVNVSGNPGTSTLTISATGATTGASFVAYLTNAYTFNGVDSTNIPSTILYDTNPVNIGSGFDIFDSIFTAPVTGLYNFSYGFSYKGAPGATDARSPVQLVTSTDIYQIWPFIPFGGAQGTFLQRYFTENVYTQMTAGDTAQVIFWTPAGSTSNYTIYGISVLPMGSTPQPYPGILNYFSGQLV